MRLFQISATLAALLLHLSSQAAAHVQFNLHDPLWGTQYATNRSILVWTMSITSHSFGYETKSRRSYTTDTNGTCTISNAVNGLYGFEVKGPPDRSRGMFLVTSSESGLVNVTNILAASSQSTFPEGEVAWAATASDARYALIGTAGVSVKAGTNVTATTNGTVITVSADASPGITVQAGTNVTAQTNGTVITINAAANPGGGSGLSNLTENAFGVTSTTNFTVDGASSITFGDQSLYATNGLLTILNTGSDGKITLGSGALNVVSGALGGSGNLNVEGIISGNGSGLTDLPGGLTNLTESAGQVDVLSAWIFTSGTLSRGGGGNLNLDGGNLTGANLDANSLTSGDLVSAVIGTNDAASDGWVLSKTGGRAKWVPLAGGGDMLQATYDADADGIVDTLATNTPSNGQLLSATGNDRKWVDVAGGGGGSGTVYEFDVTDATYGAIGDGTTDDRAAIQAAIDAASAAGSGIVYLPRGEYRINGTLTNKHFVIVRGESESVADIGGGHGAMIKAGAAMPSIFESISWSDHTWMHYGGIEDLTLQCANLATNGIQLHRPGENFLIRGVYIKNPKESGLYMSGDAATFKGEDLNIHGAGDTAIVINKRAPGTNAPVGTGSWYFDHLSGDLNTNGWFAVNCNALISVDGWKIEDNLTNSYPNGGQTILVTDNALKGVAGHATPFKVYVRVDALSCSIIDPGWTNWVQVTGSGNANLIYEQGAACRWSYAPDYVIWDATEGHGLSAANGFTSVEWIDKGITHSARINAPLRLSYNGSPTSPQEGDIWFNSSTGTFFARRGDVLGTAKLADTPNWATYSAAANVLMDSYNITGAGTVSATAVSGGGAGLTGLDDDAVGFDDANGDFAATTIGAALEELVSANGSGPNAVDGKVSWTQLTGVPAGFADGTDDGAAGGTITLTTNGVASAASIDTLNLSNTLFKVVDAGAGVANIGVADNVAIPVGTIDTFRVSDSDDTHYYEFTPGNLSANATITLGAGNITLPTGTIVTTATDDDVPESGDFGAATDLEADGSLSADVVAAAEMADADHGDVAWSAGVAAVQAVSGANAVDSDAFVDDSIDDAHVNWGTAAGQVSAADVPVAATPSNYSAASAQVEAHLAGIDTALGSAGGGGTTINVVALGSQVSQTAASNTDITGLSFTASANTTYVINAYLLTSGTAGMDGGVSIDIPSGSVNGVVFGEDDPYPITADDQAATGIQNLSPKGVHAHFRAAVGGTGGTVILRMNNTTGSGQFNVDAGSWMQYFAE